MVDAAVLRIVRLFLALLKVNPRLMENPYWYLLVLDDGHPDCLQVGRNPSVVGPSCCFLKLWRVCRKKNLHKGVILDGVDFTDKSAVSAAHWWCKNWHCPSAFCTVPVSQVLRGLKHG